MRLDPLIGAEIGGYRIEEQIGRGGMGVVYRAEHALLGRKDAVKLLSPELAEDEAFRERFLRESRTAASIEHPNIIPIHHAGEVDGLLYIAMRYVDGTDLHTLLKEHGRLTPGRTVSIIEQVASALDAAHERGLVHRDVKPANILIASADRVYLTDFGIAKHTATHGGLTRTGSFLGTLHYAAPEQIEGKDLDGRADLYALGCVVYECLTGAVPYEKESDVQLIYAHLLDAPPILTEKMPDLPGGLDDVILKALAKSRDDRYATCGELVAAMRDGLERAQVVAKPETLPARPAETRLAVERPPPTPPPPLVIPPESVEPVERPPEPTAPPLARVEPPVERPREPTAPPARVDEVPREPRRPTPVLLAAGGLVLAAVAIGAFLLSRGGSDTFPNEAEQALLAYVPGQIRDRCTRAGDAPEGAVGSVSCVVGAQVVSYSRFITRRAVEQVHRREAAAAGLTRNSGACAEPPFIGERPYRIDGKRAGFLYCLEQGSGPTIGWTADRANVYARASRQAGDVRPLVAWWQRSAGPLGKPNARTVPAQTVVLGRGQVIFGDTFANRAGGWPTRNTSDDQLSYAAGSYRIQVKRRRAFVHASTASLNPSLEFADVELELRGVQVSGRRRYNVGFVCRLVPRAQESAFYALEVRSDGVAQIRRREPGRWILLKLRRFGAIPRGSRLLEGSCTGGNRGPVELTLSLNGRRVIMVRDRSPVARRGAVGMAVSSRSTGGVVVRFADFVVRKR